MPASAKVLYSKRESDKKGSPMFWNEEHKTWTDYDHATVFHDKPQNYAVHGTWMNIEHAETMVTDFEYSEYED